MRLLVVALLALTVGEASADEAAPPPPAKGTQLVSIHAAWRWQVATAPKIPRAVGALAVSGVDVASGRATQVAPVLGEVVPRPAGWPYDVIGGKPAIGKPAPDDPHRIAAAFGVTTFQITEADAAIAMLELRLRYRDGVAVWLNGVEVVRQGLPRGTPNTLALRQHGPEWETFYIPAAPGLLARGTNTLAIEAHPSGRRAWPEVTADLIGRSDRGIVRGPHLAETTQSGATIVVETDPDVDATLEWGPASNGAADRVQKSPPGRRHVFALAGLAPGARYSYRVRAGSSQSARYGFHTLPKHGAVLRIGIYGDVRGGHAMHRRLVERMLDEGLDVVAASGDLVVQGSDEADWQRFFAITQELRAQLPYYSAVGNHDLGWDGPDGSRRAERMWFALPLDPARPKGTYWYSRDVADVHLVFLDSNAYDRLEQESWLEQDLAAARKRGVRAIVALMHDGPYARGHHGGNAIGRARYVPILVRHGVELVISGHDHIYQRGEHAGLHYVVSGGGGAPLYGIRCGVEGRPRCAIDDGMQAFHREHHYGVITVGRDLEWCPRRADGALLEKCTRIPFRRP